MRDKKAMGPASWSMIGSKVMDARVAVHGLRQLLAKGYSALDGLEESQKDAVYKHIGDLVSGVPERIKEIEASLDTLNYALSVMGKGLLKDRLTLDQRAEVESALDSSPDLIAKRVASRYVQKKVI